VQSGNSQEAAESLGELAQLYHTYGFVDAAAAGYSGASRLLPADPRWPHLLGVLHRAEGRLAEAEDAFRSALELHGAAPALRVHLGRLLLEQGRLDEAEGVLQPILVAGAVDPAAIACQGEIELARGRFTEAVRLLDLALGLVPDANRLHYPLASALRGLGDLEAARRHLGLAGEVGLRPADALLDRLDQLQTGHTAHMRRGEQAYAKGRAREAVEEFTRALAFEPRSVSARIGLAATLAAAGRGEDAIAPLREALAIEPDNAVVHYDLGALLLARGEAEAAVRHLRTAIALRPDDGPARMALARALRAHGDRSAATIELRELLSREPAHAEPWLTLAQWLVDDRDWPAVLPTLERAHELLPGHPAVTATLARWLAAAPAEALRDGERAHSLALEGFAADERPQHAETVALALAELGRCAEAAVWQREALSRLDGAESEPFRRRLEEGLARYRDAQGTHCRPPFGAADERP
jgi:tetratricopeptide (TPR) repeat protein